MKLAHFNDLGPAKNDPSAFNLITTDLELANQRISSKVIDIDGYGVDVDGSGSVSVSGSDELNYRGLAEITTKESFFTNTVARLSGAALKNGKLQFPFRVGNDRQPSIFQGNRRSGRRCCAKTPISELPASIGTITQRSSSHGESIHFQALLRLLASMSFWQDHRMENTHTEAGVMISPNEEEKPGAARVAMIRRRPLEIVQPQF